MTAVFLPEAILGVPRRDDKTSRAGISARARTGYRARLTLDMLKSGTRSAGVAVRVK